MADLAQGAALALAGLSFGGALYQLAAARLVRRFAAQAPAVPSRRPPVTVLKPLCGAEPGLEGNLRDLCRQDYPRFQVVFGLRDWDDPALPVVHRLSAELPDADLTVVVDPRPRGCNLKVGNLLSMLSRARHDVLVIADSDVRVPPDYLDDVVAPLADPTVGLVTCLYVGRPNGGVWSRLGALGINHGFLPSALVARALGRRDGCFGATMALSRRVLDAIGGLEPLRDTLADDWSLGAAVRRAGYDIALAARPVDVVVAEPSLRSLWAHEIRWGRTVAAVDRGGYVASVVTQPVALAAVSAAIGGTAFLPVLALAASMRLWAVRDEERALALPRSPVALVLLRDALSLAVFAVACCGRSVWWRGKRFRIRRDGTMELKEGTS
ncbi:MAG TPA: bacteriohopanetetrol glucosamine biosynthesis glycosyltransferase HpnI [Patescibacteria group bacterium]|nr:bacteriohopanetetrol glucosamine biosynthesis glycosyltransferase HpnI [Patescibacteria group bacterium]